MYPLYFFKKLMWFDLSINVISLFIPRIGQ